MISPDPKYEDPFQSLIDYMLLGKNHTGREKKLENTACTALEFY